MHASGSAGNAGFMRAAGRRQEGGEAAALCTQLKLTKGNEIDLPIQSQASSPLAMQRPSLGPGAACALCLTSLNDCLQASGVAVLMP